MSDHQAIIILNTCPSAADANCIAEHLVKNGLAACVNIMPNIRSYFNWEDKLQVEEEYLLIIKTQSQHYQAVQENIVSLHPYDVPEVIAVDIKSGLEAYLKWLHASVN